VQLGTVMEDGRKRKVVTEVAEVVGTGNLPSFLPDLIATGLVEDPVAFVQAVAG
jgi:hypothetical protein